jgi:hypothetical protein
VPKRVRDLPIPTTTSIFVPSADFKATILNKVLFPIKTAKPLIPLSQQLSKQNTKGISEEHKKGEERVRSMRRSRKIRPKN